MMKSSDHQWVIKEDSESVANYALSIILSTQANAIKSHGYFSIVMAGGSTPEKVYTLLSKEACDWSSWHIYLGDERCLPSDHPERNSQMLKQKLFDHVDIPVSNIHMIPAELGATNAADQYQQAIATAPIFDLVLLGMGEDGHTASLFPDHIHDQVQKVHPVFNAPKPPSERVSLSQRLLSHNESLLILITGSSKQQALKSWKSGVSLPIASVSSCGESRVVMDRAAGSVLD